MGSFAKSFFDASSKQKLVKEVFDSAASNYDKMNNLTSLYTHKLWKANFVDFINITDNCLTLDIASGSGDIADLLIKKAKKQNKSIDSTLSDYNENMLNLSKQRFVSPDKNQLDNNQNTKLDFKIIDACNMTDVEDCSFDVVTCSFGVRNFYDISKGLKEIQRVLKKGGVFYCLEFSNISSGFTKLGYDVYSKHFMPFVAKHFANRAEDYDYLVNSIENFYSKDAFLALIKDSGFEVASYYGMLNGLVCVHYGKKCQN